MDLSSFIPKDRTPLSGLRAFDSEPRRLKREGAEDHRLDSTLGIYMDNQGRVDDPVVTLEFEEDAQKLSNFLRTEEHLDFVPSFDSDIYQMVQLRIKPLEDGRAAFSVHPNSNMTESQLRAISSDAYQLYVQIRDKRHQQQATLPQANYYQITFKKQSPFVGQESKEQIFGRLAPGRGRIVDKDQAIREFKQIVSYSLQTFRNDPKIGFKQHSLIYFPEPKKPHVVQLSVNTPEEAERFLKTHESSVKFGEIQRKNRDKL